MGGNAGTQTLTIVVRGLSLGELTKENAVEILLKEIGVGILSGIVIGIVVAFGAMLMESNPIFGLVDRGSYVSEYDSGKSGRILYTGHTGKAACGSGSCQWCVCYYSYGCHGVFRCFWDWHISASVYNIAMMHNMSR